MAVGAKGVGVGRIILHSGSARGQKRAHLTKRMPKALSSRTEDRWGRPTRPHETGVYSFGVEPGAPAWYGRGSYPTAGGPKVAANNTIDMKKNYGLDAHVLLYDPQAIFKFEDNDVIIPIYVIEEVDQFKRESTERGRDARHVARLLDGLRGRGSLAQGVSLDTGGRLHIAIPSKRPVLAIALDHSAQDHAILQTAIDVRDANGTPTIFVTMDSNLRIRADALGLAAETYENLRVEVDQLDHGGTEIDTDGSDVDAFFHDGFALVPEVRGLYPNGCVVLRDR